MVVGFEYQLNAVVQCFIRSEFCLQLSAEIQIYSENQMSIQGSTDQVV